MPHADPEERPWYCAGIPHPQFQLFVFRCPHDGRVVAMFTGGTCEEPQDGGFVDFGPFDTAADVAKELGAELGAGLSSLWLR